MKYVAERIENGTGERPLKGLLLESTIYYVNTKQEILDEQTISQGRVANLVVYAKDIKKWLVFNQDGSSYEEKDLPSGQDLSNYVEKNSESTLKKLSLAFVKENKAIEIYQDTDKNSFFIGTGDTAIVIKDKNTGDILKTSAIINENEAKFNVPIIETSTNGKTLPVSLVADKQVIKVTDFSELYTKLEDKKFSQWITDNPNYTKINFIDTLFSCYAVSTEFTNWTANIKISETYKNIFPQQYMQLIINNNGGILSNNYIHCFAQQSSDQYFAGYKRSEEINFKKVLYVGDGTGYDGTGLARPTMQDIDISTIKQTEVIGSYNNISDRTTEANIIVTDELGNRQFKIYILNNNKSERFYKINANNISSNSQRIAKKEQWLCEVNLGTSNDPIATITWTRVYNAIDPFITSSEMSFSVNSNNDRILSPQDGIAKSLLDEDKSENGYGKDGNSSYFQPLNGLNQSLFLEKIEYSKIWAIHSQISTNLINLVIHEDIIAQLFLKDVSDFNSFCMLLDPVKSKAKLGKYNQQAIAGTKISFNGDIIPDTEDANKPTKWINNNGEVTDNYSDIKNVTYSIGSFVNVGTTIAVRGDVSCDIDNGTSTIVQDNNSKYFVIPARAGGGTFSALKLLPLYIARTQAIVEDFGSYMFEDNADAIGKFLEIIYNAAVDNNEELENQEELQIQSLFAFDNQNILINNLKVG